MGSTISLLEVACTTGTGQGNLDWLTVQNGAYAWAPLTDIQFDWEQTGWPGGCTVTFIKEADEGDMLLIGSNVGGFAWSAPGPSGSPPYGYAWYTANGSFTDFQDSNQLGVWEGWSPDTYDMWILTGRDKNGPAPYDGYAHSHELDGLWYSPDRGQNWTVVDDTLGANRIYDDCVTFNETPTQDDTDDLSSQPNAAGNILVPYGDFLYAAGQEWDEKRGIYVVDAVGDVCKPYDESSLAQRYDTGEGGYISALPSALASSTVWRFRPVWGVWAAGLSGDVQSSGCLRCGWVAYGAEA